MTTLVPGSYDRVEALSFLGALVEDLRTPLSWRAFHDTIRGAQAYTFYGSFDDVADQLGALSRQGYGTFAIINTVAPNGHDDASVIEPRAVFIDGDGIALPTDWPLKPTLVVMRDETHWHAYWMLESGEDIRRFREAQRRLIAWYGSDPAIINESRVMRVPGFLHQKDPLHPSMYRVVSHAPALSYTIDAVLAAHPAGGGKAAEAKPTEPPKSLAADDNEPIPSGERNSTLASLAGSLRHIGLAAQEIGAALQAINRRRCQPPLEPDEVANIARSIARYDFDAADAAAAKGKVPAKEVAQDGIIVHRHEDRLRLYLNQPPQLVAGLLPMGGVGAIIARPGVGKTLMSLELARCVALGVPFAGKETRRGRVVYVCPDSPRSTGRRMLAMPVEAADRVLSVPDLPKRLPADVETLRSVITAESARHPDDPVLLLVIDTYDSARTHAGGGYAEQDASAETTMGALRRLADELGIVAVVVHHATKGDTAEARGTDVFRAKLDWMGIAEQARSGVSLRSEKVRDGERGQVGAWTIEARTVGDGDVPVLVPVDGSAVQEFSTEARDLSVLRAIAALVDRDKSAPSIAALAEALGVGKGSQTTRPVARLRAQGLLAANALMPTAAGRETLTNADTTYGAFPPPENEGAGTGGGNGSVPGNVPAVEIDVKLDSDAPFPGTGGKSLGNSVPATPFYKKGGAGTADVSQSPPNRKSRLSSRPSDAEDLFGDDLPKPRKRGSL